MMEALALIGHPPRRRARLDERLPVRLEGGLEEVEGLRLALRPVVRVGVRVGVGVRVRVRIGALVGYFLGLGLGLALRPVGARGLQPLRRVHVKHALAEAKALLRDTRTRHGLPR